MTLGDNILLHRKALRLTQEGLAERIGVTQATVNRYENDLRTPDVEQLAVIARALNVTSAFLETRFDTLGATAVSAHMRRQKTAVVSDWKWAEARLNVLRQHLAFVLDRVPMRPTNQVPAFDAAEVAPEEAASLLRAQWRMPLGPIRDLTAWIESAGVFVFEEDFGTHRIDGVSQWVNGVGVILVNSTMPTSRRRLTLAHELGHLVLHRDFLDGDVEDEANEFAGALLMPRDSFLATVHDASLPELMDAKIGFGVSMQAAFERAFRLLDLAPGRRQAFYRQLNARNWKVNEPGEEELRPERPRLSLSIIEQLASAGIGMADARAVFGVDDLTGTPFVARPRLRAV